MFKKSVLFFVLGLIVHLYTTFVLTLLWNWFVTIAFHVAEISFWLMYGLVLIVQLFQNPSDRHFAEEQLWGRLTIMVDACVPDEHRDFVKEQLEEQQSAMWTQVGTGLLGRIASSTVTLGIAFVVHVFASV